MGVRIYVRRVHLVNQQLDNSLEAEKLAYVCLSRAEENLQILFYTNNAVPAKQELIQQQLFSEVDIGVITKIGNT